MEGLELLRLSPATLIGLLAAGLIAVAFEAVNGFHDTANAVATVIYTNTLSPRKAVLLSGCCNFSGVYLGGVGVAFAIVHLLPVDLLVNVGSRSGTTMILAILIAAIGWNIGTWYRGIPASSSHTLIGAIVGVAIANALMHDEPLVRGLNLGNVKAVALSLFISPLLGFVLAPILLITIRTWIRDPRLNEPPQGRTPPPWVRAVLVCTSAGVSLAHGSNDGQKGVGLMMIILIGILPAHFALSPQYWVRPTDDTVGSLEQMAKAIEHIEGGIVGPVNAKDSETDYRVMGWTPGNPHRISREVREVASFMKNHERLATVNPEERAKFREKILLLEDHIKEVERSDVRDLSDTEKSIMKSVRVELRAMTDYAPAWVILIVATAIGLGTMVGWKRVVVTIGERIGRRPLTYAQGASSEVVAMLTIGLAAVLGLPVSTTHVLSSGVAGTMVANRVRLRYRTLRDIALAWILTLPVTILAGATLFFLFHFVTSL